MSHDIQCPRCAGKGTVELPKHLKETLEWLERNPHSSARQIRDALDPYGNTTMINNRLVALEELGLVERGGKNVLAVLWFAR